MGLGLELGLELGFELELELEHEHRFGALGSLVALFGSRISAADAHAAFLIAAALCAGGVAGATFWA